MRGLSFDQLQTFVVEYYRMCLPAPKGKTSKNNPTPVMAEFCHQLLTAHQEEASRAFVPLVTLLEKVLDEASLAGDIRPGLNHSEVAGVILSTIMFNAAYAHTISGEDGAVDGDHAANQLWEFLSSGIVHAADA